MADEEELVEQVVLEPEDHLAVLRVRLQARIPAAKAIGGHVKRLPPALRVEPGANAPPLFGTRPGRDRTLMEDFGPDAHVAGDTREAETFRGAVAVMHVEHGLRGASGAGGRLLENVFDHEIKLPRVGGQERPQGGPGPTDERTNGPDR